MADNNKNTREQDKVPGVANGITPNEGPGWSDHHGKRGDIHHYGGKDAPSNPEHHGKGNEGGSHAHNHSGPVTVAAVPGLAVPFTLTEGIWGFTLFSMAEVSRETAMALSQLETMAVDSAALAGRFAGFAGMLLTPVNKPTRDGDFMGKLVMSLPLNKVTDKPVEDISALSHLNVPVKVQDVVDGGIQKIGVVRPGKHPISVKIVDAHPTKRPRIYSAKIQDNVPPVHIHVNPYKVKPGAVHPQGVTPLQKPHRISGVQPAHGHAHDAIIRFHPGNSEEKVDPVYLVIIRILAEIELQQQEEENKRRQAEWDARHPVEAAQRDLKDAISELSKAIFRVNQLHKRVDTFPEELEAARKRAWEKIHGIKRWTREHEKRKARYHQKLEEFEKAKSDLVIAIESRRQKEEKKKDAESKLEEARKNPRKGTRERGHKYYESPRTDEIKGLGELKWEKPVTPRQGGNGKRARWSGDKGRKIYEWDYSHGELEGYRTSDGQHIGAFEHKTGRQIKPAIPGRRIKKLASGAIKWD